MFSLTKSDMEPSRGVVWAQVERQLEPIFFEIGRAPDEVAYRISSFAPFIRYSMFAPFSEARLLRQRESWVLQLKLSRLLLLPFGAVLVGLLAFRMSGPISVKDGALALAGPMLIVVSAIMDARRRLLAWWSSF